MSDFYNGAHLIHLIQTTYRDYFEYLYFGHSYEEAIESLLEDNGVSDAVEYNADDIIRSVHISNQIMLHSYYGDDFVALAHIDGKEKLKAVLAKISDDPDSWIATVPNLEDIVAEAAEVLAFYKTQITSDEKAKLKTLLQKESEWEYICPKDAEMTPADYVDEAIHYLDSDDIAIENMIDDLRFFTAVEEVSDTEIKICLVNDHICHCLFGKEEKLSKMIHKKLCQLHPELHFGLRKVSYVLANISTSAKNMDIQGN